MVETRQALDAATDRLATAGIDTPRVDAELLLSHVIGVPRSRLLAIASVHPSAAVALDRLVSRRAKREPLQHLVGRAAFRYVEVAVGPGVFVPRPETELLIDAVLPVLRSVPEPVAVDLCSGSGALALAVADEVPAARVIAVELEEPAADWLRRNTRRTRVEVVLGDVGDADLLADLAGRVDAVVCNPPYVPTGADVADEVRFDPAGAVFAGPAGLALMPCVVTRAAELLRPGGVLAVEHDESQARAVPELLTADGRWRDIADHRDLADRPRYATAVRS